MVLPVSFAELPVPDVRVDLGGGNELMTEEFLDHAKVGAVVDQVGGETVAKPMGRNFREASVLCAGLDSQIEGGSSERFAPVVEKYQAVVEFLAAFADVFAAFEELWPAGGHVILQRGFCSFAEQDEALFIAFADDPEELVLKVLELVDLEGAQFLESHARGVGEFEERLVA